MEGVNRKPGDPNYDLFQLALKSTSLRLYPNYANVEWSGNAGFDRNNPETYFSKHDMLNALREYKRIKKHKKDEMYLIDLIDMIKKK